jgi:hypothetical protein
MGKDETPPGHTARKAHPTDYKCQKAHQGKEALQFP